MKQASAVYRAAVVVLFVAIVLLPTAAADPLGFSEGGGLQAAKWDFSTLADYVTNNVTLAAGNATLATTATWWSYTTDATFLASQDSSTNVVVSSGLRLINNATGLIQDGTFNLAPGPWTYASGTTNQVIAQRDPVGRARLSHSTPRFQFDSMDAVFGTRPWRSVANGQSASTLAQSTAIREEGTGSLRDYVTINSQGSGSYAGAYRNDWGTWNWSAYNRLAIWIEGTNASGLSAFILMTNLAGVNWASWMPQHLAPGWHRYVYDISAFSGTNDQIDQVQVDLVVRAGEGRDVVDVAVPSGGEVLRHPAGPVDARQVRHENEGREAACIRAFNPNRQPVIRTPIPGSPIVAVGTGVASGPLGVDLHVVPNRPSPFLADCCRLGEGARTLAVRDAPPGTRPEHRVHRIKLESGSRMRKPSAPDRVPLGDHLIRRPARVRPRSRCQVERPVLDQSGRVIDEAQTGTHDHVRGRVLGREEGRVRGVVPPGCGRRQCRVARRQRHVIGHVVRERREVPLCGLEAAALAESDRVGRGRRQEHDR